MSQDTVSSLNAKYVYCIIRMAGYKSFGNIGLGKPNANVYTISFKELSAVVSDTPFIPYEPNEENALAHERVVETVMREHTVLPVRFCTIFKNGGNLRAVLARLYDKFLLELRKLDGKVEVGLKVLWKPDRALQEVEKKPSILKLKHQIESQSVGIAYLLRKKLNENITAELNRRADAYSDQTYRKLKRQARAAKLLKPIGHMILNAAFLIDQPRIEDLRVNVKELERKLESKGLEFVFSGPWPPYNFVTVDYH